MTNISGDAGVRIHPREVMGMLVFISDLHFVDGSAGEHNTPWRAFDYFFNHISNIATKKSNKGKIKEIKIIFLGDIFDLLRTENWFEPIPAEERPWGNKAKETEGNK